MKETIKFYKCSICQNIIEVIEGNIENITCCGKQLEEIKANTCDASKEKHVPVYTKEGDNIIVEVGETLHPMDSEHYIMWIAQVEDDKITRITLQPNQKPQCTFKYIEGSIIYAYCNKHGLWKKIIN